MATPRQQINESVQIPGEVLTLLGAFEEVLEALLVYTAPGTLLYQRDYHLAADANRTGKRLLGNLRGLRHGALSPNGNSNGQGRGKPQK